ncbi:hypothetical protein R3P38DRAFT_1119723 [Favolaschia claudopus]|uniref:Uncharacterized protein n=1 Tax=Favolaschia claudopus TaxID=2862362 RepID=A0AAW0BAD2_9AGAR
MKTCCRCNAYLSSICAADITSTTCIFSCSSYLYVLSTSTESLGFYPSARLDTRCMPHRGRSNKKPSKSSHHRPVERAKRRGPTMKNGLSRCRHRRRCTKILGTDEENDADGAEDDEEMPMRRKIFAKRMPIVLHPVPAIATGIDRLWQPPQAPRSALAFYTPLYLHQRSQSSPLLLLPLRLSLRSPIPLPRLRTCHGRSQIGSLLVPSHSSSSSASPPHLSPPLRTVAAPQPLSDDDDGSVFVRCTTCLPCGINNFQLTILVIHPHLTSSRSLVYPYLVSDSVHPHLPLSLARPPAAPHLHYLSPLPPRPTPCRKRQDCYARLPSPNPVRIPACSTDQSFTEFESESRPDLAPHLTAVIRTTHLAYVAASILCRKCRACCREEGCRGKRAPSERQQAEQVSRRRVCGRRLMSRRREREET